jgi:hypothetical protein
VSHCGKKEIEEDRDRLKIQKNETLVRVSHCGKREKEKDRNRLKIQKTKPSFE